MVLPIVPIVTVPRSIHIVFIHYPINHTWQAISLTKKSKLKNFKYEKV